MISKVDILLLHEFSILDYGGLDGVRDENALLSAIARPFQTFDGKELYNTPYEKAAALGESLIINHPFIDGNKRTGLLAMVSILLEYDISFEGENQDVYDFIIAISTGEKKIAEIAKWLIENSK